MPSFGQVVPVVGTLTGFLGEVSRTGGGDPEIVSKLANVNNAANINFGDAVVLLPDSSGGTYKQFADWVANGGGLAVATAITSTSTTATPTSLNGLSKGMLVQGTGIPVGTLIASVNPIAGTITLSQAATATNAAAALVYVEFAGFAVREVRTNLGFPYPSSGSPAEIGSYPPGSYVSVIVRGGITLKNAFGTPITGGPLYLRVVANAHGAVGDVNATSDTTNSILLNAVPSLADAFFKTGVVDSNNLVEVIINNRSSV